MTEISKEYGTALFMLACENGEQKSYANILKEINMSIEVCMKTFQTN